MNILHVTTGHDDVEMLDWTGIVFVPGLMLVETYGVITVTLQPYLAGSDFAKEKILLMKRKSVMLFETDISKMYANYPNSISFGPFSF